MLKMKQDFNLTLVVNMLTFYVYVPFLVICLSDG